MSSDKYYLTLSVQSLVQTKRRIYLGNDFKLVGSDFVSAVSVGGGSLVFCGLSGTFESTEHFSGSCIFGETSQYVSKKSRSIQT